MTIRNIIPTSEKSLRPTRDVSDFSDSYIQQVIKDLLDTLKEKQRTLDIERPGDGGGVGLAANQIDYPYEPVSDTDLSPKEGYYPKDFTPPNIYVVSVRPMRAIREGCEVVAPSVYVNAIFRQNPIDNSKSTYHEGCFSVNGFTGFNISRYEHILINAYNEKGDPIHFAASGFIARVHQHAIDHGSGMEYLNRLDFTHAELKVILSWIERASSGECSELSEWVVLNKLQCTSAEIDFGALQTWVSHQILKMNVAAANIQGFFTAYHLKKQTVKQHVIVNSPYFALLSAFDLRFQCMKAVAAAKFSNDKPIEDPAQVERVINSIRAFATEKGIINLDVVERIFRHNIFLAERIQSSYYDLIWRKSYHDTPSSQRLMNNAYAQLQLLIRSFDLSMIRPEIASVTSADVLDLAREIIQTASKTIIEVLADSTHTISSKEFSRVIKKMLATYMTPGVLLANHHTIDSLADEVTTCARR